MHIFFIKTLISVIEYQNIIHTKGKGCVSQQNSIKIPNVNNPIKIKCP
jgi:hypothetical protein